MLLEHAVGVRQGAVGECPCLAAVAHREGLGVIKVLGSYVGGRHFPVRAAPHRRDDLAVHGERVIGDGTTQPQLKVVRHRGGLLQCERGAHVLKPVYLAREAGTLVRCPVGLTYECGLCGVGVAGKVVRVVAEVALIQINL